MKLDPFFPGCSKANPILVEVDVGLLVLYKVYTGKDYVIYDGFPKFEVMG